LLYATAVATLNCTEAFHRGFVSALGGNFNTVTVTEVFEVLEEDLLAALGLLALTMAFSALLQESEDAKFAERICRYCTGVAR